MSAEVGEQATLDALEAVAEGSVCLLDPPERVAGSRLRARVEPADGEALAGCLDVLSRHGESVLVMGSGSRMHWGNPARGVSVALSSRRLNGITEFDPADGVIQVRAGTPLSEVSRRVESEGWLLPLDFSGAGGTVGGALATADCGPRQRGFGPVRDAVLGIDTVLASGERTRCGARVVKNVTGYDLAKLYVGSLGTLAVIEKVWLRLKPIPACVHQVERSFDAVEDAFAQALAASRRSSARAVGLVAEPPSVPGAHPGPWRLLAEFAGEEPTVRADTEWLVPGGAPGVAGEGVVEELRARQAACSEQGLHARIHLLPGALAGVARRLRERGAHLVVYPEPAVVHARFEPEADDPGPDGCDGVLGLLEEIRGAGAAEIFIESLPAAASGERDVFAGAGCLELMRAIKGRFDPDGILNPGRFAGGI